jgi:alpha-L-fucosidase
MKRLLFLAAALLPVLPAPAEEPPAPAVLREKFLEWRFGMFIHFNMATFNNRQWATGTEDPATFAPAKLDCGQWLDAAAAAGMKYAVLTVKHTGGWCLWDSKLLNVGPDDTGRIPDYAVKRLREIGARLAVSQPGPDKP